MTDPTIPEHIRSALAAGHVALVAVSCDRCGTEHRADYVGATQTERFEAARQYLADTKGWSIGDRDLCPNCTATDAIDEQVRAIAEALTPVLTEIVDAIAPALAGDDTPRQAMTITVSTDDRAHIDEIHARSLDLKRQRGHLRD